MENWVYMHMESIVIVVILIIPTILSVLYGIKLYKITREVQLWKIGVFAGIVVFICLGILLIIMQSLAILGVIIIVATCAFAVNLVGNDIFNTEYIKAENIAKKVEEKEKNKKESEKINAINIINEFYNKSHIVLDSQIKKSPVKSFFIVDIPWKNYSGNKNYYCWIDGENNLCFLPYGMNKIIFNTDDLERYNWDEIYSIHSISEKDIIGYGVGGGFSRKDTVIHKDASLNGALLGGAIAGPIGAYIGGREKSKVYTDTKDERYTFIKYNDNRNKKIIKISGIEALTFFDEYIPNKLLSEKI